MAKKKAFPSERKTCLFLEWVDMPKKIQDKVADWHQFGNDIILKMSSEFEPCDLKDMTAIEEYWQDQSKTNGFEGDLKKFIKEYGLEFEMWVVEQKFDLEGIDKILVEVCW